MASKVRYFKVLGGNHSEAGITYKKGQIVPTTRDLREMFGANMFKETTKKGRSIGDEDDEDEDDVATIPLTDEQENATKKISEVESKADAGPGEKKGESVEKIESKLGDDVSENFSSAVSDNDLAVVKRGKHFFVVDRDAPNAALNKTEVLNSEKEVEKFVAGFLKG